MKRLACLVLVVLPILWCLTVWLFHYVPPQALNQFKHHERKIVIGVYHPNSWLSDRQVALVFDPALGKLTQGLYLRILAGTPARTYGAVRPPQNIGIKWKRPAPYERLHPGEWERYEVWRFPTTLSSQPLEVRFPVRPTPVGERFLVGVTKNELHILDLQSKQRQVRSIETGDGFSSGINPIGRMPRFWRTSKKDSASSTSWEIWKIDEEGLPSVIASEEVGGRPGSPNSIFLVRDAQNGSDESCYLAEFALGAAKWDLFSVSDGAFLKTVSLEDVANKQARAIPFSSGLTRSVSIVEIRAANAAVTTQVSAFDGQRLRLSGNSTSWRASASALLDEEFEEVSFLYFPGSYSSGNAIDVYRGLAGSLEKVATLNSFPEYLDENRLVCHTPDQVQVVDVATGKIVCEYHPRATVLRCAFLLGCVWIFWGVLLIQIPTQFSYQGLALAVLTLGIGVSLNVLHTWIWDYRFGGYSQSLNSKWTIGLYVGCLILILRHMIFAKRLALGTLFPAAAAVSLMVLHITSILKGDSQTLNIVFLFCLPSAAIMTGLMILTLCWRFFHRQETAAEESYDESSLSLKSIFGDLTSIAVLVALLLPWYREPRLPFINTTSYVVVGMMTAVLMLLLAAWYLLPRRSAGHLFVVAFVVAAWGALSLAFPSSAASSLIGKLPQASWVSELLSFALVGIAAFAFGLRLSDIEVKETVTEEPHPGVGA